MRFVRSPRRLNALAAAQADRACLPEADGRCPMHQRVRTTGHRQEARATSNLARALPLAEHADQGGDRQLNCHIPGESHRRTRGSTPVPDVDDEVLRSRLGWPHQPSRSLPWPGQQPQGIRLPDAPAAAPRRAPGRARTAGLQRGHARRRRDLAGLGRGRRPLAGRVRARVARALRAGRSVHRRDAGAGRRGPRCAASRCCRRCSPTTAGRCPGGTRCGLSRTPRASHASSRCASASPTACATSACAR